MAKKIILIIIFLLLLIAIPITVYLVKQQQELRERAAPATALYFDPSSVTKNVGDTMDLAVKMDTNENYAAAAVIKINFDPNYLQLQTITVGTALPEILLGPEIGSDYGSITLGSGVSGGYQGQGGYVSSLSFITLAPTTAGTTVVDFVRPPTGVSSSVDPDKGQDVLLSTTPASITITAPGGASPVPSPSAGPSATPGSSPQPSASPQVTRITSPVNGSTVTTRRPTISGESFADAFIVFSISLSGTSVVNTSFYANASGGWSYAPTSDLADGTYSILVTAQNEAGTTESASSTFTVSVSGTGGGTNPTPTPTPQSTPSTSPTPGTTTTTTTASPVLTPPTTGDPLPTIFLLGLATLFILIGSMALIK